MANVGTSQICLRSSRVSVLVRGRCRSRGVSVASPNIESETRGVLNARSIGQAISSPSAWRKVRPFGRSAPARGTIAAHTR